jgi:RNA polymerase sigma-70 factor (ECF subfamily)
VPTRPLSDSEPDEELLRQIAAGQAQALVTLFRRRRREVHRFATHMTGSSTTAEDVTQDVFMTVMCEAVNYDGERGTVIAWLLGITRNHVRRRLARDRWLRPLDDQEVQGNGGLAITPDPMDELDRAVRVDAVRRAVMALPIRYREVVLLCDLEELSYADAAAALGCAVGTVRSRLHRGRGLLAEKLRKALHGSRPAVATA